MTTEQQILDIIKSTSEEPTSTEDYTSLIIHVAVLIRACRPKYSLTLPQIEHLHRRSLKICDLQPLLRYQVCMAKEPFWMPHCDNVLSQLHDAGLLAETLGVAHL